GKSYSVIGDPVFLEIIGADLLGPVAAADHRPSFAGNSLMLLGLFHFQKARPENPHGLFPVFDLGLLVLHRYDRSAGNMGKPHRRIRSVDRLAAWAGRAECVNSQVLGIYLDVDLFGFGQDGDSDSRSVNAARCLSLGYSLDSMNSRFMLQPGEHPVALNQQYCFLDASDARLGYVESLNLPGLSLRVSHIHSHYLVRKKGRFVAAGTGSDFKDNIFLVVRVFGYEQDLQVLFGLIAPRFEYGELAPSHFDHLGVVLGPEHLACFADRAYKAFVLPELC